MKKGLLSTVIAVLALFAGVVSANGQTVGVRNICSGKVLQRLDLLASDGYMVSFVYNYNEQWQLVSTDFLMEGMSMGGSTIDYVSGTKDGFDYDVHVYGDYYSDEGTDNYIKIGDNGFAVQSMEIVSEPRGKSKNSIYKYVYNEDNQLISRNITGDINEWTTFEYTYGDLVTVTNGSPNWDSTESTTRTPSSIENKGNYPWTDCSLGEMFLFVGGMLGIPTKHLPEFNVEGADAEVEFDSEGYIISTKTYRTEADYSEMHLYWTDMGDAKVENETFALDENVAVYNLSGQKIYEGRYSDAAIPSSQICLIRSNGKTKRVFKTLKK